jgi:hypothetical protein
MADSEWRKLMDNVWTFPLMLGLTIAVFLVLHFTHSQPDDQTFLKNNSCSLHVHDVKGFGFETRTLNVSIDGNYDCNRLKEVCNNEFTDTPVQINYTNMDCRWYEATKQCMCDFYREVGKNGSVFI